MTPKRPGLTSHNNNGRALGLNQRALDFCFHKWKAFRKKPHKAQICMIVIARVSSTAPDESLQLDFNCDFSHTFYLTSFKLLLTRSSFNVFSKELDPKGHRYQIQKCGTKKWGLDKVFTNWTVIPCFMTSWYGQNCLWFGLSKVCDICFCVLFFSFLCILSF